MNSYDARAGELQRGVRHDEAESLSYNFVDHSSERVAQSVINIREDVVMLVCYASCANQQLATIRRLLWVIVIAVTYEVARRNWWLG